MNKLYYFNNEINLIKDERIQNFLKGAILDIPEYFFEAPASSSGKHHPRFALGKGGLLRHTKAAVQIAKDLLSLEKYSCLTDNEKDLIVCALVLHDTRKSGDNCDKVVLASGEQGEIYESKTLPLHPKLAALAICSNKENFSKLSREEGAFLLNGITSHMGQWNTTKEGKVILPKPNNLSRELIHICDYLASRKAINFNFDDQSDLIM